MGILMWIGVAILSFLLVWTIREDLWFLGRSSVWTKGRVIGYVKERGEVGDIFFAKLRFETAQGHAIEITDTLSVPFECWPLGGQLDVVYPADAPERAQVHRPMMRLVRYFLVICGFALLLRVVWGLTT